MKLKSPWKSLAQVGVAGAFLFGHTAFSPSFAAERIEPLHSPVSLAAGGKSASGPPSELPQPPSPEAKGRDEKASPPFPKEPMGDQGVTKEGLEEAPYTDPTGNSRDARNQQIPAERATKPKASSLILTPSEEMEEEVPEEEAPALVNPEDVQVLEKEAGESSAVADPEAQVYDVPITLNEKVKAYIHLFQTSRWGVIARAFERAGRYLPMIREIFAEKGLPQDLINLAYIESAFNPLAYSKAKALGIWQFIEPTGRRYGLKSSYWLDERRDPEKSTRAAADYLSYLYGLFQSWPLALAAYNAGEQRIQEAIERQGTTDFWALKLPKETELFVPAFMAMTIIAKNPERYGFTPPQEQPWVFDRVKLKGPVDLRLIAKLINIPLETIRKLNPELLRWITPSSMPYYEVKLPPGTKEELLQALAQVPQAHQASLSRHRIRKGETLAKVASRYRIPVRVLAELNGIKPGQRLQAGTFLHLPAPTTVASRDMAEPSSSSIGKRVARHRVRKGDTLWRIARTYDVSVKDLKRWNQLDGKNRIHPGQVLLVSTSLASSKALKPQKLTKAGKGRKITYIVKRGDALWRIARAYDVSVRDLLEWNDLTLKDQIRPGQRLYLFPQGSSS